ncbi:MAG: PAS domain S-box protein, partial [Bacteroidota bacterium]|nr:PAS domain S-box protein [Bacteroidota bacterium]
MKKNKPLNQRIAILLTWAFFLILLGIATVEWLEYNNWRKNQRQISYFATYTLQKEQLVRRLRKENDQYHIYLLNSILEGNKADQINIQEDLQKSAFSVDQLYSQYQSMPKDNIETQFFQKLLVNKKEYTEKAQEIELQLRKETDHEAIVNDLKSLNEVFANFQGSMVNLSEYVADKDNKNGNQIVRGMKESAASSWNERLLLFGLLIILGFLIALTIRRLQKSLQMLSESERKYRTLIERTTEIIETANQEGKLISVNDTFCKKLEYNYEEIPNLHVLDTIAPESRHLYIPSPKKEQYGEILTGVKKTLLSKTGRKIDVEGNILLNFKEDNFEGFMAFYNDITEKKKIEQDLVLSEIRYKSLFDLNPLPTLLLEKDSMKIKQVNRASMDKFG